MGSTQKALVCLFVLFLSTSKAELTIIHCGLLIDCTVNKPQKVVSLLIKNGTIIEIADGYVDPGEGDLLIDLNNYTVLPGLMDMHVHLSGESHPKRYMERFTLDLDDYAFRSIRFSERTLMAGFTTVRDLGGPINNSLRDAINNKYVIGPRIFSAGKSLATTGGHADPTNGMRFELMGDPGPSMGVVNGESDAMKAVRQRYKNGADLIKITATGGVLSVAKSGENPQFKESEIRAIVETARDYDMHVAAHAHGAEGMKRAIRAGVRSIEHGTLMDDEVVSLMVENGTYYVPTISAGEFVAEKAELDGYYPEIVRPKAKKIGPQIKKTFQKAHEGGVKIAFGTDSGVSYHGENANEFSYMVEGGMTPMEAIMTATKISAELLGVDSMLGTIEPNKKADVIAVEGNPLEEISVLKKVVFVMKDGFVYKNIN